MSVYQIAYGKVVDDWNEELLEHQICELWLSGIPMNKSKYTDEFANIIFNIKTRSAGFGLCYGECEIAHINDIKDAYHKMCNIKVNTSELYRRKCYFMKKFLKEIINYCEVKNINEITFAWC